MTNSEPKVNAGDTAPIKNVATCLNIVRALQNRHPSQPNLGVFAGFSGYGKSVAALFTQNKTGAAYVEVSKSWRPKALYTAILTELGEYRPKGTLSDLENEIIGRLARQPKRPLIIDESDLLVKGDLIEYVRIIAKKSCVPVLLIGEENFPKVLERAGDRFRDLILPNAFGYARACDLEDALSLCRTLYPQLSFDTQLLQEAIDKGNKNVRRICNSIHAFATYAATHGLSHVSQAKYTGDHGVFAQEKLPSRKEREAA